MKIEVLRLHHRKNRDKRITTHLILSSRILGIKKVYVEGDKEEIENIIKNISKLEKKWGKGIEIEKVNNWRKFLKQYKGIKIHLTMYGIDFHKKIKSIKEKNKNKKILIIVGSEKVEGEVYRLADYNIAVTHQPHSEITALVIFLYELRNRKLKETFKNAKIKVKGKSKGKEVIKIDKEE